jgi:hypothetical protein
LIKSFIISIGLICSLSIGAEVVEKDRIDYAVEPTEMNMQNAYYSLKFYKNDKFSDSPYMNFDVEDYANTDNNLLIYSKVTFLSNSLPSEVPMQNLKEKRGMSIIFGTCEEFVNTISSSPEIHHLRVPVVIVKDLEFDVHFFGDPATDPNVSETLRNYVAAAEKFDANLPSADLTMVQYADNFNRGAQKSVMVTKLIPHEDKTLIVIYQLTRVDKKWFNNMNFLSFGILKKEIKKSIALNLYNIQQVLGN